MRLTLICLACYVFLGVSAIYGEDRNNYTSKQLKDIGMLSETRFPLFTRRYIVIREVPIITYGRAPASVMRALSSPVYATSEEAGDQGRDINIVSISGVSLEFRDSGENDEAHELLIDVRKARVPDNLHCDLADVVRYALICIRMIIPPNWMAPIRLKVLGGETDPRLMRLESDLWSSTSLSPDKRN